jgi:hypothetical protein
MMRSMKHSATRSEPKSAFGPLSSISTNIASTRRLTKFVVLTPGRKAFSQERVLVNILRKSVLPRLLLLNLGNMKLKICTNLCT